MGATALLTYAALNAGIGLGAGDMHCGFPAMSETQPSLVMEVAPTQSLYGARSTLPVHLALSTGKADVRMSAMAQPLGPNDAPFVVIAGSPAKNVVFQLGLKDDGSASLTIRDLRRGAANESQVTRVGRCSDQENFFLLFNTY